MSEDKFWIVFVEGTSGGSHHKHITHADAIVEAERLAALNKGRKVIVVKPSIIAGFPKPLSNGGYCHE